MITLFRNQLVFLLVILFLLPSQAFAGKEGAPLDSQLPQGPEQTLEQALSKPDRALERAPIENSEDLSPIHAANKNPLQMNANSLDEPVVLNRQEKDQLDRFMDKVMDKFFVVSGADANDFVKKLSEKDYRGLSQTKGTDSKLHELFLKTLKDELQSTPPPEMSENLRAYLEEQQTALESLVQHIDASADDMQRIYGIFSERIHDVTDSLGLSGFSQASTRSALESSALLRGFSARAKIAISKAYLKALKNMKNEVISGSFEKVATADEGALLAQDLQGSDAEGVREMTLAEEYWVQNGKQYEAVDAVFINSEYLRVHRLLNPPAELHPYLKWLLYTRKLTPRMVNRYLQVHEKIMELYKQAKEGNGFIRYKGKVYGHGPFLPFAENAASNYELVRAVPQV